MLLWAAACAAAAGDPATEIPQRLHSSADAWNHGDLSGFLAPYLDSPSTTFVGGSGLLRGFNNVRSRYEQSYWSNGRPPYSLSFTNIEVRPLGNGHALAIGQYLLTVPSSGETAATGYFSLVWRNTAEYGWQIIHDHSSAARSP